MAYAVVEWDVSPDTWSPIEKGDTLTLKHLIKSDGKLFGLIDGEWSDVTPIISDMTNLNSLEFETHGIEDLSFLATPKTRAQLIMEGVKLEGEGKTFSRKIKPSRYKNSIIEIKEI